MRKLTTTAASPAIDKGDFDRAVADYNEAIRLDPKYALAYYNRGNAYYRQGRPRPRHRRLQRGDPTRPEIRLRLQQPRGRATTDKGDYDRAIADYNEAIRLDPKFAHAYSQPRHRLLPEGDLDRAIADYGEAIRLDPKFAYAYNNRGNACYDKHDENRAIADYSEAIRLDPKYAQAYYIGW